MIAARRLSRRLGDLEIESVRRFGDLRRVQYYRYRDPLTRGYVGAVSPQPSGLWRVIAYGGQPDDPDRRNTELPTAGARHLTRYAAEVALLDHYNDRRHAQ